MISVRPTTTSKTNNFVFHEFMKHAWPRGTTSSQNKKPNTQSNGTMTKKDELRRQFRHRRSTAGDLEVLIQHQVSTILRRVGAGTVGLYWPLAGEVNLLSLCQRLKPGWRYQGPMVVGIWTIWPGAEPTWSQTDAVFQPQRPDIHCNRTNSAC